MPLVRESFATSADGMPNVRRRRRVSARSRGNDAVTAPQTDESRGVADDGHQNKKVVAMPSEGRDGESNQRLSATALTNRSQPPSLRQALALDTRIVIRDGQDSSLVEARAQMYETLIKGLLYTGAIPKNVVFTGPGEAPDSLTIESRGDLRARHIKSLIVPPTVFRVGEEEENSTPKPLQPKKSWKVFGSMIHSICSESDNSGDTSPLAISLVTHATSLLGEKGSHKEGLGSFVDQLHGYFATANLQSLRIFVAEKKVGSQTEWTCTMLEELLKNKLAECEGQGGVKGFPLAISIHSVDDSSPGYQQIVRYLVREALGVGRSAQLAIDLPEVDGMQCQLSFEASYHILATSIEETDDWNCRMADLSALSAAGPLQVQQLIPYSALDASLLYGVPLRLSTSWQTAEWESFQAMHSLWGSLMRLLHDRDLALLLRVPVTATGKLLARPRQTLVLMPRETPVTGTSRTALLWAYATGPQCLDDGGEEGPPTDEDVAADLQAYVDNSLDQVFCGPYNPLVEQVHELGDAVALTQDAPAHSEMDTEV